MRRPSDGCRDESCSAKVEPKKTYKHFHSLFVFNSFFSPQKPKTKKKNEKIDGDDSSNDWWRSDHEEELIRLISTPIVDAIMMIDENNREE